MPLLEVGYWLTHIDDVEIPKYDLVQGHGNSAASSIRSGLNGGYETRPSNVRNPFTRTDLPCSGVVLTHAHYNQLLGKIGRTVTLKREAKADSTIQIRQGRLDDVGGSRNNSQTYHLETDLIFSHAPGAWDGIRRGTSTWGWGDVGAWDGQTQFNEINELYDLSSGSNTLNVYNAGNVDVTDGIFTITAGDAPITNISITTAGKPLNYDTTAGATVIAAGDSLIVDCSKNTLTYFDSNTSGLTALSHAGVTKPARREWIVISADFTDAEINPTKQMTVALTGGGTGSTLLYEGYDKWA